MSLISHRSSVTHQRLIKSPVRTIPKNKVKVHFEKKSWQNTMSLLQSFSCNDKAAVAHSTINNGVCARCHAWLDQDQIQIHQRRLVTQRGMSLCQAVRSTALRFINKKCRQLGPLGCKLKKVPVFYLYFWWMRLHLQYWALPRRTHLTLMLLLSILCISFTTFNSAVIKHKWQHTHTGLLWSQSVTQLRHVMAALLSVNKQEAKNLLLLNKLCKLSIAVAF